MLFALCVAIQLICYAAPETQYYAVQNGHQVRGDVSGRYSPDIEITFVIEKGHVKYLVMKQVRDTVFSHFETTLRDTVCGASVEESDAFKAVIAGIFKQNNIPIHDVKVHYTCRNHLQQHAPMQ